MKLNKPYTNREYAVLADYCNKNGQLIEDKGDYLESVNPPEPTVDELKANVRAVRNRYLEQTDKYLSVSDFPITDEEREQYKAYRQYLRDYTETEGWYESNPLTFDVWQAEQVKEETVSEEESEIEAETEQP